jgi:predicted  nucleic acid-binding Zn-ribbon protein
MPKKLTLEEFKEKGTILHNGKYSYELITEYKNNSIKYWFLCPIHGKFKQCARDHLTGRGCPKCVGKNKTLDDVIKQIKDIHGNNLDLSLITEYKNEKIKLPLKCNVCGHKYTCTADGLLNKKSGCPKCGGKFMDTEWFIKRAIDVHGEDECDYSKVIYTKANEYVILICKRCGKEFYQTPNSHLNGRSCPNCRKSKLEKKIKRYFKDNNIEFNPQHKFEWLTNPNTNNKLIVDFYLPKYNIVIEAQGEQHFRPVEVFGGEKMLKDQQARDKIKYQLCIDNNTQIIYIAENKVINKVKREKLSDKELLKFSEFVNNLNTNFYD